MVWYFFITEVKRHNTPMFRVRETWALWNTHDSHYQGGFKDQSSNSHKLFLHFDLVKTHVCCLGLGFKLVKECINNNNNKPDSWAQLLQYHHIIYVMNNSDGIDSQ